MSPMWQLVILALFIQSSVSVAQSTDLNRGKSPTVVILSGPPCDPRESGGSLFWFCVSSTWLVMAVVPVCLLVLNFISKYQLAMQYMHNCLTIFTSVAVWIQSSDTEFSSLQQNIEHRMARFFVQ